MSNLIRINPIRWPYSLSQLRIDEPSRSFSSNPSDFELAYYDVYRVITQPIPSYDPTTHRVVENFPLEINGQWLQNWIIVELSDAEKEDYYRKLNPPRWIQFSDSLPVEVDGLLANAQAVRPSLAFRLAVGLGQAAQGDPRVFLSAWQTCREIGLITTEFEKGMQALAVHFDLPTEFVAGLSGQQQLWNWPEDPERGDQWTRPDESVRVFDQPQAEDGTYLAADPATEEAELELQWLPVEAEL